ncbi:MAG TPA: hypothetical protein V6C78_01280 [Crinalium sp.]|jgi:hypothetical protein
MQTYQQRLNYEKLELIRPEGLWGMVAIVPSTLNYLWETVRIQLNQFNQSFDAEPQVEEVLSPSGMVSWKVYEPKDDCYLEFDTAEQVLVWLEMRT